MSRILSCHTVRSPFQPTVWIGWKRVGHGRQPAGALNLQLVLTSGLVDRGFRRRHLDDVRIEERVATENTAVRNRDLVLGLDDQELRRLDRIGAVDRSPGNDNVVTGLVGQRTEVGLHASNAAVHEEHLVGVRVAEPVVRRVIEPRVREPHVVVEEERRAPAEVVRRAVTELGGVQAFGAAIAFDRGPADRRLGAVDVAGLSKEAVATELFFDGPLGDLDVGLTGNVSANEVMHA